MATTNQELKRIMKSFKLSQTDVQGLLGRGRTAVYYWTREPKDPNFQKMHPSDLRLLKLELRIDKPLTRTEMKVRLRKAAKARLRKAA